MASSWSKAVLRASLQAARVSKPSRLICLRRPLGRGCTESRTKYQRPVFGLRLGVGLLARVTSSTRSVGHEGRPIIPRVTDIPGTEHAAECHRRHQDLAVHPDARDLALRLRTAGGGSADAKHPCGLLQGEHGLTAKEPVEEVVTARGGTMVVHLTDEHITIGAFEAPRGQILERDVDLPGPVHGPAHASVSASLEAALVPGDAMVSDDSTGLTIESSSMAATSLAKKISIDSEEEPLP